MQVVQKHACAHTHTHTHSAETIRIAYFIQHKITRNNVNTKRHILYQIPDRYEKKLKNYNKSAATLFCQKKYQRGKIFLSIVTLYYHLRPTKNRKRLRPILFLFTSFDVYRHLPSHSLLRRRQRQTRPSSLRAMWLPFYKHTVELDP